MQESAALSGHIKHSMLLLLMADLCTAYESICWHAEFASVIGVFIEGCCGQHPQLGLADQLPLSWELQPTWKVQVSNPPTQTHKDLTVTLSKGIWLRT